MNERIRLLAEQAMETVDVSEKLGMPGTDLVFNKEKFAQLIVRECLDIISPYAVKMENFDGGHPIADLKKHFGLEE